MSKCVLKENITMSKIVIENKHFALIVNENAVIESLFCKDTEEDCLYKGEEFTLFSLNEPRPFNNEIKLSYPNKMTTFQADRIRREGDLLYVGFELVGFEAVVELKVSDEYVGFTLKDFIYSPEDFAGLSMTPPPVYSFRLIQLPIASKSHFGNWLNVMWDEKTAVNVLATSPYTVIDSEKHADYRVLYAETLRDVKLKNTGAAIITSNTEALLDCIDRLEKDFGLPKGVESRRKPTINRSVFSVGSTSLEEADGQIEILKKCGIEMIKIHCFAFFKQRNPCYGDYGDYEYDLDKFPGGEDDIKAILEKFKAAGIHPGFHVLQTHIGINTSYVTPELDHRLNLKRHLTLSRALGTDDTTVYVEENPEGCEMHEKCRVLRFGTEAIYYESFTTEPPYRFEGCKRGHYGTYVKPHEKGTIGGVLDVSEYSATSIYADQKTSLQDEVAEKLARLYNLGFEFAYFDGSEGATEPYGIYVPLAQYRVYKKFDSEPLFCEGAAKAHFSWHMLSGANAFDVFPVNVFKKCISRFPCDAAKLMRNNFTRVNFGWWVAKLETQVDIFEYGSCKAVAWDCPTCISDTPDVYAQHKRINDIFEMLRRWEDARRYGFLTDEQKEALKDAEKEFTLLINENGEYELAEYFEIKIPDSKISAFSFERCGKSYVVYWHNEGSARLRVKLSGELTLTEDIGKEALEIGREDGEIIIPADNKKYLCSSLPIGELRRAFENCKVTDK